MLSHWYDSTPKKSRRRQRDSNPRPSALEPDALTLGQRGAAGGREGERERERDRERQRQREREREKER